MKLHFAGALFIFNLLYPWNASCQRQFDLIHYPIQKKVVCKNGAVVSAQALASEVGVAILKQGGNAVDAAIATQLALAVVFPAAGNIGGGGFMIIHLKSGKNMAIDFREIAPGKAYRDMYLDANGNPQMHLSQDSLLAAGVPGSVAGIFAALPYAKLPLRELIQPAINLAENGYALSEAEAGSLNEFRNEFIRHNTALPVFVRNTPWKEGDTLVQKDLAKTLKRIRDYGQKGFYEGETARLVVQQMEKGKGIISMNDLKNYKAIIRQPLSFDYEGNTVLTMPLSSSGGIILEQMMKMCRMKGIDTMQFETPESVQLMVEAERRAYADRAFYLGDPAFVRVPVKTLVDDAYLENRIRDFVPGKAGNSKVTREGVIPKESMETTHFDVIDHEGNAVSETTTLNGWFGCRTVVAGAGFFLNNEMDDFSVKPGVPNMYGAVGAEANAIAPYKRMLSSMTPTIVLKKNKPWIIAGTPGGTTIPTSVFQTLTDLIDFKMDPEDAVDKPKFHHQWLPDEVDFEKGFNPEVIEAMKAMGYRVKMLNSIGRTEVIMVGADGTIIGIGDRRGDDAAEGY
jgi:gamma-glutamyltranspeptidase / glutathione hydrolase